MTWRSSKIMVLGAWTMLLAACRPASEAGAPGAGEGGASAATEVVVFSDAAVTLAPGESGAAPDSDDVAGSRDTGGSSGSAGSSDATGSADAAAPAAAAPACPDRPTSADQEGPYYSTAAPERANLREPGMAGRPILLSGLLFDADCRPIAGARVDLWHADAEGEYDNEGYRLRGQVVTGADGSYQVETITPTAYTGRPPHIHLKVFDAAGTERLTTQLYFPGAEGSADVARAPDLLVGLGPEDAAGRTAVRFDIRLGAGE